MTLALDKLSILVVEDTPAMQKLLVSVLTSLGFPKPLKASNGVQGFEMFQRHNPDIVITDWLMSPGDGLEMTRKIRNNIYSPNKMVPVILLTGYSSLSRVEEARDAGVTEFLVKPFTAIDVSKRIMHVINNPRDFVSIKEYFGPDRRRRKEDTYSGPRRRENERQTSNPSEKKWTIEFGD
ncbi:MAG: response regulator [Micavibrio aeruginosavorus]|uniref:Response regulator n=1 Tax=Micavibrio aeruginosavorus TaxID=349221 RepID=A0A2W5FQL0_9BACT|nr:MAG: response regulator [Micavibrio aeruginosavorus]